MHREGENMQPREHRWRQRPRNLFDLRPTNCSSGKVETRQKISKKDVLEKVAGKFKAHVDAKKNPIMAAVKFDRRQNAIAFKSLD